MVSPKLARLWLSLKPSTGWAIFLGVFLGGILHPYSHLFWLGIFELGTLLTGWILWKKIWWGIDDHFHYLEALEVQESYPW